MNDIASRTPLARRYNNRPVLYIHYVDDPSYEPDPETDPNGAPGIRPLRFLYNPTLYDTPRRDDATPFVPKYRNWGQWLPRFIEAIKHTSGLHKAARQAGIAPETVARFRLCSPDLDSWITLLREERTDNVEDALYTNATEGKNTLAMLGYLNANRPDRYKRPGADFNVTGQINVNHSIQIVIPDNGRGDRAGQAVLEGEYRETPLLGDGEGE